ncbi:DNA polymerase [Leptotrichia wadei]|uniref:DNA polymerase n=1 Tax=Leptotrichia wadei TaxID=157687 RepID=UPI0028DB8154|nr:DNA polymerase [Leptotrichia wadei]
MDVLNIDIETYSSIDIGKSGLYKYAQSNDFEILLFAYSLNGSEVKVIDLAQGETVPDEIIKRLSDNETELRAYNANFEWYCLNRAGFKTNLEQWKCTMIHAYYAGFPGGLGKVGKALGFEEDKKKDMSGKALIRYFSVPCKATRANGGRTRNLPYHDLDKWNLFVEYNRQDVVAEMAIMNKLKSVKVPEGEWEQWRMDIRMNERGIAIDTDLVDSSLWISEYWNERLMNEARDITGLDNPNSTSQLLEWLKSQDVKVENLQKATVEKLIKEVTGKVKRVLEIRKELSKTSTKKYVAMKAALGEQNRVRGLLQFYGANRTGRWAGRLVQVQNLPRNYIQNLSGTREVVKRKDVATLEILYGNIPDTLSQLIRTAFIPEEGKKFVIADFSAIEARVIAWLAGEHWRSEVFKTHGKIYEASASQMFGVPIEKIKKGNPEYALRQKGKVAELALGYQGGPGALKAMGALNMGLTEEELPGIVRMWRDSNKNITGLWWAIGSTAIEVVEGGGRKAVNGIIFEKEGDLSNGLDFLTVLLPSGRKLYYVNPGTRLNSWDSKVITYMAQNQTTGKWETAETYGGKLVENIVQAIARDCLAVSIKRLTEKKFKIVMHIHDEVVIEAPMETTVDEVCEIMGQEIEWAKGLLLRADGFETMYYKKD